MTLHIRLPAAGEKVLGVLNKQIKTKKRTEQFPYQFSSRENWDCHMTSPVDRRHFAKTLWDALQVCVALCQPTSVCA